MRGFQTSAETKKKLISILGDSVSTLEGLNPEDYNVFYQRENCEISGVREYGDTWWGQLIDYLGGELLVNDSWSGSRVTKLPSRSELFPSGISDERINNLGDENRKPDIIIVMLGDNDWGHGVSLSKQGVNGSEANGNSVNVNVFCDAYDFLLKKLKYKYPNAEIFCCTLFTTYMPLNPGFVFPLYLYGNSIESYNSAIADIARGNNCRLIDLYLRQAPVSTIDGSHPDKKGMRQISKLMYRRMFPSSVFTDCENQSHHYILSESHQHATNVPGEVIYLCTECYRTISLFPHSDARDYLTLVNIESACRFRIFADKFLTYYTAEQFFGGRIVSEFEIIEYAKQLLEFLSFAYDSHSASLRLYPEFHFFFSPHFSLIDEHGYWIISSCVGEPSQLFQPGFNAPEAYNGIFNEQTDIFAFGMALYWLATKSDTSKPPYETMKVRKKNPGISRGFSKLIEKCIETKPEKRYKSFDEVRGFLYKKF